jgi:hypothetical protein
MQICLTKDQKYWYDYYGSQLVDTKKTNKAWFVSPASISCL